MNKQEFLNQLLAKLFFLSKSDRDDAINYFSELIDEAVEHQKIDEQIAIANLGGLDNVVAQIVAQIYEEGSDSVILKTKNIIFNYSPGIQKILIPNITDIDIKMRSKKILVTETTDTSKIYYYNKRNKKYSFFQDNNKLNIEEPAENLFFKIIINIILLSIATSGAIYGYLNLSLFFALLLNFVLVLLVLLFHLSSLYTIKKDFVHLFINKNFLQQLKINSSSGKIIVKNIYADTIFLNNKSGTNIIINSSSNNLSINNKSGKNIIYNDDNKIQYNIALINNKSGKNTIDNICFHELKMENNNGLNLIENINCKLTTIKSKNGAIKINNLISETNDIQNYNGKIKIKNAEGKSLFLSSKNGKIKGEEINFYSNIIKNINGKTKVTFIGSEEDYNISLKKIEKQVKINKKPAQLDSVKTDNDKNRSIIIVYNKNIVKLEFIN